jgi:hypothetical protein
MLKIANGIKISSTPAGILRMVSNGIKARMAAPLSERIRRTHAATNKTLDKMVPMVDRHIARGASGWTDESTRQAINNPVLGKTLNKFIEPRVMKGVRDVTEGIGKQLKDMGVTKVDLSHVDVSPDPHLNPPLWKNRISKPNSEPPAGISLS